MICFDLLFNDPTIDLVERYQVDSIVFPTAWGSKLPLVHALGLHEGVALRLGVNFLSSRKCLLFGYGYLI